MAGARRVLGNEDGRCKKLPTEISLEHTAVGAFCVCPDLNGVGGESNGERVEGVMMRGEEHVWDTSLHCHSTPVQLYGG